MIRSITRRRALALSAASAATLAGAGPLWAEDYPSRTITLIVPYSPGGGTDIAARMVAAGLSDILKQTVVVLNKPGAGSIIGAQYVQKAAPDGYTLLFTACDGMVMDPAIYENLPYDTLTDFSPITDIVTFPLLVVVKANSPFKTIQDLVTYANAHPEKANYASSSSVFWLGTELFSQKAGLKLTRVPYKGAGNMVLAVMSGDVLFALPSPPPVIGQMKSGTIRILATTAPQRLADLPDVPTMAEAGVPGVVVTDWSGMWAPPKTPAPIIATLNKAVRQVLTTPEFQDKAKKLNLGVVGDSPEGVKQKMIADLKMWKVVAKQANISMKL
ncbi:MAG: tripartite tricarboxylate transporter substrate binding protein [Rhodopseudomonas sp.]|nr:tripartite tricarboxylate transporter substrate binding protein [Rhodopseudomonas sp.]